MLAQQHLQGPQSLGFPYRQKTHQACAGRWVDAPYLRAIKSRQGQAGEGSGGKVDVGKGKITELIEEKIFFKC